MRYFQMNYNKTATGM